MQELPKERHRLVKKETENGAARVIPSDDMSSLDAPL